MNTTVILAAGRQERFGDSEIKHLVDVGGETLIGRTLRILDDYDTHKIVVVRDSGILDESFEYHVVVPDGPDGTCQHALWTRPLWSGRTVILLGDVIWTRAALDEAMTYRREIRVVGRWSARNGPNPSKHREIFAVAFDNDVCGDRVAKHLRLGIGNAEYRQSKPMLWEFYWSISGKDRRTRDDIGMWHEVCDETDDIDTLDEYETYVRRVVVPCRLDDMPKRTGKRAGTIVVKGRHMTQHKYKVGSVQGLIMALASFDRRHGIEDPPPFLAGFKAWCEETGTDQTKYKDVRDKLNKIARGQPIPEWFQAAKEYYSQQLDHGHNALIIETDDGAETPVKQSPKTEPDAGNNEAPNATEKGGKKAATSRKKSQGKEEQQEEAEATPEIEDVEPVVLMKTFEEFDEEKGIEDTRDPNTPEIPGPNDSE